MSRIDSEIDFNKPGKQCGFLRLPLSRHESAYGWLPIPIVCINAGAGPTVLLVSGNHGDEYEGQVALLKLCRRLQCEDVHGRIIILPAANFPAVIAGRRVSPLDSGNLNRSFPGDPDGSPTAMIADYIENELMPLAGFVADLHSGGSSLDYIPSVLAHRTACAAKMEEILATLRVFGAPVGYLVDVPEGGDRTLASAADRKGLRYLGAELGGGGTLTPRTAGIAEQGLARFLDHVGVLHQPLTDVPPPPSRILIVEGVDYYAYAPDSGIFEPYVCLGDEVHGGESAGAIHFPDTPWREPSPVYFARDGVVLCRRFPGRTERGDCLFHLGADLGP
jgi:uncharacterized protein